MYSHLTLRKIAIWLSTNFQKLDIFSKKIAKNFLFFQKKLPMAIFLKKMKIFGNFFWKNVKFLAIFWQSNGNFPEGQTCTGSRPIFSSILFHICVPVWEKQGIVSKFKKWVKSSFWISIQIWVQHSLNFSNISFSFFFYDFSKIIT